MSFSFPDSKSICIPEALPVLPDFIDFFFEALAAFTEELFLAAVFFGGALGASFFEEAALFPLENCAMFIAFSKVTSFAFLSTRKPIKIGWRAIRPFVHSVNLISQTNFGFTHVTGMFPFGHFLKGHSVVIKG